MGQTAGFAAGQSLSDRLIVDNNFIRETERAGTLWCLPLFMRDLLSVNKNTHGGKNTQS